MARQPLKQTNNLYEMIIDGRVVPIRVRINRRAKRYIMRIDQISGEVQLTSPSKRAIPEALDFAQHEANWIAHRLAVRVESVKFVPDAVIPVRGTPTTLHHTPEARRGVWLDDTEKRLHVSGDRPFVERRVSDWLRQQAKSDLRAAVQIYAKSLNVEMPPVTIRDPSSRWGSCSPSGNLSFSWRLILADPSVLTYVAAHETAHLKHLDHSKAFWATVEGLMDDYKTPDRWLQKEGQNLYRFG